MKISEEQLKKYVDGIIHNLTDPMTIHSSLVDAPQRLRAILLSLVEEVQQPEVQVVYDIPDHVGSKVRFQGRVIDLAGIDPTLPKQRHGKLAILTESSLNQTSHYVIVNGSDVCPNGTPIHEGKFDKFADANDWLNMNAPCYTGRSYMGGL